MTLQCRRSALVLRWLGVIALAVTAHLLVGCKTSSEGLARHSSSTQPGARPMGSVSMPSLRARMSASARGRTSAPAIPGALPTLDEEVWVIVQNESPVTVDDDTPGTGALLGVVEERTVPMPLRHTDVRADVTAAMASVDVTQTFTNPFDTKVEAVYVFPLPQNAAVNGFVMTVGDRRIRGIIRDRETAEVTYAAARSAGHVASLLTQERPNVFTQKVANIEPGHTIDIAITYFNTLSYDDGWYEFVFPMVVGPRFNPPDTASPILAVPNGAAGGNPSGSVEVPYLRPGERTGHDISVAVDLDAGVAIEDIGSSTHPVDVYHETDSRVRVALASERAIPNRDFVLRWRVAGDVTKSALLTHRVDGDGYFTFMLVPPATMREVSERPLEMIFVLDCSGSMNGKPLAQSKEAVVHALRRLGPNDTFQIIRFSNGTSSFGRHPVPATPANVRQGVDYVTELHGEGGTMMLRGIEAALGFEHDPERFRVVTFLTDGFIGNEQQVLAAITPRLGASRIFSFGVGASPNRFLMNRMAKIGRGAVAYLTPHDDGRHVMGRFLTRVRQPVVTDLAIDYGRLRPRDVTPTVLPDLFVGRPVYVSGRFDGSAPTQVTVSGIAEGQRVEATFDVAPREASDGPRALASIWARRRISELVDDAIGRGQPNANARHIERLALEYGLMSEYTAFVAVDSRSQTGGDFGVTVPVAVPVPAGTRYDTTVSGGSVSGR